jgi:hypothetical protein
MRACLFLMSLFVASLAVHVETTEGYPLLFVAIVMGMLSGSRSWE